METLEDAHGNKTKFPYFHGNFGGCTWKQNKVSISPWKLWRVYMDTKQSFHGNMETLFTNTTADSKFEC